MMTRTLIVALGLSLLGMVAASVGGCGTEQIYTGDMAGGGGSGGSGGGGSGGTGGSGGSTGTADMAGAGGSGGSGGGGGDMATTAPVSIVGTWLSTGANLAKGFTKPPFNAKSISGVFKSDFTYTVSATDTSGKTTSTSGTWVSMPSTVPGIFNFTQHQTQPSAATAQGIYQIDATMTPPLLTLEGVQTSPSLGATPPTATGGFGSTIVNGQKTSDWIQKYVRQ